MSYNALNYTEPGGDVTHIGGELVFDGGASVKGFPGAVNMAPSEAETVAGLKEDFNSLLAALKEAGVMQPDDWDITVRLAPSLTDPVAAANNAKASVVLDGDEIIITADVDNMEESESSEGHGTHKWLGLGIGTGLSSAAEATYNGVQLTEADVEEAVSVGLDQPGEFVLYLKADRLVKLPIEIELDANARAEADWLIRLVAPAEPTPDPNSDSEGGDGE